MYLNITLHQFIAICLKEGTTLSSVQCTSFSVYQTCLVCNCEHPGRYFLLIPGPQRGKIQRSLLCRIISNTIDFPHDKSHILSIATSHNYAQDFSVATKISAAGIVKNSYVVRDRCGSRWCIEDWNTTVLRCKKWTKDRKIAFFVLWRVVIKSVYYLEIGDDGLKYLLII